MLSLADFLVSSGAISSMFYGETYQYRDIQTLYLYGSTELVSPGVLKMYQ